jgi:hypothetical protein
LLRNDGLLHAVGGGEELPESVNYLETGDAWIMLIEFLQEHTLPGWLHTDN